MMTAQDYILGQMHVAKCLAACDALLGSWRMGNLTDFGNIMDEVPTTSGPWFIQDDRLSVPIVDELSTLPRISSSIGCLIFCFAREWDREYLSASL